MDLERPDLEIIWVEYNISNKKHLLASCYRPPGQSRTLVQNFISSLRSSFTQALQSNSHSVTILGDFNDRCTLWDSNHSLSELKNDLHSLLLDLNLFQLISSPTRGNYLLDLLITDSPVHFYDHGTLPSISELDHDIIYGKFKYFYTTSSPYSRRIWKYDQGDYPSMNTDISQLTTIDPNNNIDTTVSTLTHELTNIMSKHIPNNNVTINPKDKPWFTLPKLYKKVCKLHLKP